MPDLGKKYTCYSCHTKFYDLGKPVPLCPKCNADQRDADETPIITSGRGRSRVVVEEPADEPDFGADSETPAAAAVEGDEDEEVIAADTREDDDADDEEEEEF